MTSEQADEAGRELTAEQEATWFAYMRLTLRLNYEINRELQADSDLSHQDFHVLNALADSPGLFISRLTSKIESGSRMRSVIG